MNHWLNSNLLIDEGLMAKSCLNTQGYILLIMYFQTIDETLEADALVKTLKTKRTRKKKEVSEIETPFNTFANRADPDQAALVRAA